MAMAIRMITGTKLVLFSPSYYLIELCFLNCVNDLNYMKRSNNINLQRKKKQRRIMYGIVVVYIEVMAPRKS